MVIWVTCLNMNSYEHKNFQKSLDLEIKSEIVIKDEPFECVNDYETSVNEQQINHSGHQVKESELDPKVPIYNEWLKVKIEDNANNVDKHCKKEFLDQGCIQNSQSGITGYKHSDRETRTSQNYVFGCNETFFCKIQNSEFPKVLLRRLDTKIIEMCDSSRLKSKRYINAEMSESNTTDDVENKREDLSKYSVGDVVWVNVRGNPLWPGMIAYSKNASPDFIKLKLGSSKKSVRPRQYHVQFFNDNHQTMWASSTSIFPYNGLQNLLLSCDKLRLSLKSGKCKVKERNLLKQLSKMGPLLTRKATNSKSLRWYEAVVEADDAMSMRTFGRIRWLKSQQVKMKKRKWNELNFEISLDPTFVSSLSSSQLEPNSSSFFTACKLETLPNSNDSDEDFSGFEDDEVKSGTESLMPPKSYDGESMKDEVKANMEDISEAFIAVDCEIKDKIFTERIEKYEELKNKRDSGETKTENNYSESTRSKEDTNCEVRNEYSLDHNLHSNEELVYGQERSESALIISKRLDEANEKNLQLSESFKIPQEACASLSSSPSGQEKSFSADKVVLLRSKNQLNIPVLDQSTKLFKCFKYNFETKHKSSSRSHSLIHSDTKQFKCSKCDYKTNCKNYLKIHVLNHSDTRLFKCFDCDYETNRKVNLRSHLLIHSDTKLFKCSECDYKTNFKFHLKTHILIHSDTKLFKCSECNYETRHKSCLKTHLLDHAQIKLFKCPSCDYETNHKTTIKTHLVIHSDIKLFKCSECDFETKHKFSLKSHLLNHLNTRLFKCFECSYETNEKRRLKTHLLNHSGTKAFKCSECDFETNRKDHLKTHLLIHSKIKLLKCPECVYETNNKRSFKIHLLNHSNTRLFKCSECDYETNQKGRLKIHFLIHSEAKLFKCWECDYKTNYKSSLKTHLLDHSDKKLFKCSDCNYQTNYKSSFNAHLLTHTDTKLFKCSECDYETNRKDFLQKHLIFH